MNNPQEIVNKYSDCGVKKANSSAMKLLIMSIMAGIIIALSCVATNTIAFSVTAGIGTVKMIMGLVFPFGLAMVIFSGSELFTGNCLMVISIYDKKIKFLAMIRNWMIVYFGNFMGSIFIAYLCSNFGQLDIGNGELAVFTANLANYKCSLSFSNAFVLGFLCNFLVAFAVLLSFTSDKVSGKFIAMFLPVAFFVMSGFEHSVANMYYISAGLFVKSIPAYDSIINSKDLFLSSLSWSNFLWHNLLPVTLGNIAGGVFVSTIMWFGHRK